MYVYFIEVLMLLEVHQLYLYIYMHMFIKKNTQFIKKKKKEWRQN